MNGIRYISAENRVADTCPGGRLPKVSWRLWQARPSCLRLLVHLMRAAASRTFWTAGRSRPIRMAMIAITTSSSIRVKPRRADEFVMTNPLAGTGNESIGPHVLALPDGLSLQRADGLWPLPTRKRDTFRAQPEPREAGRCGCRHAVGG